MSSGFWCFRGNMCSWQFSLPGENWQRLLFPLTCGMDT
ncbi:hypothetical protein ES288_D01G057400v1 [Gossypium darwinii]|uniref:Uncharacterized protein n=1 Tax=Gossypium darwinii TaxID=34276 RepID=A0A5D2DLY8_GOSDA|nr:hypothetical protein ES288_D01G057400v1 [Gossypium darwinii]